MNSNNKNYTDNLLENTMVNGRVDFKHTAANPLGLHRVTYQNANTGKEQSQCYLEMEDFIVPVIIKKDPTTGELLFAMQYESLPSSDHYANIELPDFPFSQKKDHYSDEDVIKCIDDNLSYLGLKRITYSYLDSDETAVSQSITDQLMKAVCISVEQTKENNNLVWYPISCINDFLRERSDNVTTNDTSTLPTKYALRLFFQKYKKDIDKSPQTEFKLDDSLVNRNNGWNKAKTLMEHKYRFGEQLMYRDSSDDLTVNFGEAYEMGTSKNSVQCIIIKTENGKKKIGLSRQQRSPFINRAGISEFFYEEVGGMIDGEEDYETAVKREVREETGIEIGNGKLTQLTGPIMLIKGTQEASLYYLYEMDGTEQVGNLSLDDQECIDAIEWIDIDSIDFKKYQAPLLAKYGILLAKEYFEKTREEKAKKEADDLRGI